MRNSLGFIVLLLFIVSSIGCLQLAAEKRLLVAKQECQKEVQLLNEELNDVTRQLNDTVNLCEFVLGLFNECNDKFITH